MGTSGVTECSLQVASELIAGGTHPIECCPDSPVSYSSALGFTPQDTGQHQLDILGFNVSSRSGHQFGVVFLYVQLEHVAYFLGAYPACFFHVAYIAVEKVAEGAAPGCNLGLALELGFRCLNRRVLFGQNFQILSHSASSTYLDCHLHSVVSQRIQSTLASAGTGFSRKHSQWKTLVTCRSALSVIGVDGARCLALKEQ
ncbi:hypothetical protein D3C81_1604510 [compost metagenome]